MDRSGNAPSGSESSETRTARSSFLAPGTGEHEDLLLVATTERIRREDLDRYLDVLKGF